MTERLLLRAWRPEDFEDFARMERRTGKFIGRIGLWHPEGWPGGWLLDRTYWGQGLATEGGRAALDYAFTILGADHVISVIDPANARSIRVAEHLGERLSASTTSTAHEP